MLLIAVYPLAIGLLSWGRSPGRRPALSGSASGVLVACAVEFGIFAVVFGLAWLASRASVDDLLLRWKPGALVIPLGVAYSVILRMGIAVLAAIVLAVSVVFHIVTTDELQTVVVNKAPDVSAVVDVSALKNDPVYLLLTMTVVSFGLGGFREELWRAAFLAGCRRLGPKCFGTRRGEMGAMLLAAVVFGAGHAAQGPIAMVLTGLLGVGLGAIIVVHRSIWPAVIAHGIFDATSIALIPWAMDKMQKLRQMLPR
jgi:membrane protease YdiL (CAAX protease family)